MKTAIVGIGGVGGFIAGKLLEAHDDIVLIARGDKARKLREKGLYLDSDIYGNIHIQAVCVRESLRELDKVDLVFVCVKNYSLDDVIEDLKVVATKNTIIVPVMNGIEPGNRIRQALPHVKVVDGVIYIVSFVTGVGHVWQQGQIADLRLGGDKEGIEVLKDYIGDALPATYYEDIVRQIWRKYILNMAYNVETAYYDNTIGQLRDDEKKSEEYHALIEEAAEVARRLGVDIRKEDTDDIWNKFFEYHYDATSSLQRDIRDKKRLESDIFTGYLVREASKLGIELPVTKKMHERFI